MIIDLHNYTNEINEQLTYEEVNGSNLDDFLALVNITKELLPLANYDKEELMSIWKKYRTNNHEQNHLRLEPYHFQGFKEIVGLDHIKECFEQGGIFATFHFGHYRHVPFHLAQVLPMNQDHSFDIVVDRESYNSESELTKWNELRDAYNVNYIVSEEQNSGLKLLRLLKNGRSILLYLDGNSGSGEDSNPIEVQHITSLTKIRSGIFRLMQLTKKPMCLVIADQNKDGEPRLVAFKPIRIQKDNFEESVKNTYRLFRETLFDQPGLWRFWYRHHLYVNKWMEIDKSQATSPSIDWRSYNDLGVDLSTGDIYRL